MTKILKKVIFGIIKYALVTAFLFAMFANNFAFWSFAGGRGRQISLIEGARASITSAEAVRFAVSTDDGTDEIGFTVKVMPYEKTIAPSGINLVVGINIIFELEDETIFIELHEDALVLDQFYILEEDGTKSTKDTDTFFTDYGWLADTFKTVSEVVFNGFASGIATDAKISSMPMLAFSPFYFGTRSTVKTTIGTVEHKVTYDVSSFNKLVAIRITAKDGDDKVSTKIVPKRISATAFEDVWADVVATW